MKNLILSAPLIYFSSPAFYFSYESPHIIPGYTFPGEDVYEEGEFSRDGPSRIMQ